MHGESWVWQQDGDKAHTGNDTVAWLRKNTPNFIGPHQWSSKSPDLNVVDYCICTYYVFIYCTKLTCSINCYQSKI